MTKWKTPQEFCYSVLTDNTNHKLCMMYAELKKHCLCCQDWHKGHLKGWCEICMTKEVLSEFKEVEDE